MLTQLSTSLAFQGVCRPVALLINIVIGCCIKTQTALLLTLKYRLSENLELTKEQLVKLFIKNENKLSTGFVGTPLLCNVLSENGLNDLAYKLLLNEEYPGWLHEIKLGATTVWERWNSVLDDGSISGTGMNSLNHYSYGSIVEWMFRHGAGLDFLSEERSLAGCRKVTIRPQLNWELKSLKAIYDSPAGKYQSSWEFIDSTHVKISVKIPFGCTAVLVLPYAKDEKQHNLSAGEYVFTYETSELIKKEYSTHTPVQELKTSPEAMQILKDIDFLDRLPKQFLQMSLRELSQCTGGMIKEEDLDRLDQLLAQF